MIRNRIFLGTMLTLLLGVLIFNSPLQSTAVIKTTQQPPIDIPQPGIPFEIPGNGSKVYLDPGKQLIIETPAGVSISLIVGKGVNISVIEGTDLPASVGDLPGNASGIGRYLEIELDDPEVGVEATLRMPFTDGDLPPGVAADQLFFAFYNTSTGEWQGVPSWVRDYAVYANTTHFSTWTVLIPTSPSTIFWLPINNVKDGFLISFSLLSLFLATVALINRRQK